LINIYKTRYKYFTSVIIYVQNWRVFSQYKNNQRTDRNLTNTQALVSLKKYMPPPLPYFKVNICPFPLPHFASIFFAYLWTFRWPNYIVTLPRYLNFSFRLPHLNIPTRPPSDELDKNIQRTSLGLLFSHWNGYSHSRFALDFSHAFGIL
jgi:hypothetical protein